VKNQDGSNSSTASSSIIYEVDFDEYGGWWVAHEDIGSSMDLSFWLSGNLAC
jgi:hypothetical protein